MPESEQVQLPGIEALPDSPPPGSKERPSRLSSAGIVCTQCGVYTWQLTVAALNSMHYVATVCMFAALIESLITVLNLLCNCLQSSGPA